MKVKRILRSSRDKTSGLPSEFPGWLHERFGSHYAQISTDTTLKLKSACKDVSRLLRGHVPDDIEFLSRKMTMPPQGITDYNFVMGYKTPEGFVRGTSEPGHAGSDKFLLEYIAKYPKDWEIVKKALGLGRQKGRHASAFLIANKPVDSFIPMTTVGGVRVTSFTAGPVEAVGGLKMDFLVINSLRDIQDCINMVQQRYGGTPQDMMLNGIKVRSHELVPDPAGGYAFIWDLPSRRPVFEDIANGKTETVFQFSTGGVKKFLPYFRHSRPDGSPVLDSVQDLAIFTALDRPGPLDYKVLNPDWGGDPEHPDAKHNMLVEYARRARGAKPSPEVAAVLDELAPETKGVIVFQETLQRVYQQVTGCTGTEAEQFRRDVAKKKKESVDKAYPFFMEKATAKLKSHERAQQLWDTMKTFAQYGFNKSHAVCYADIGYACAWLKHFYPLEWWCSVLRNATKDEVNTKFWPYVGHLVLLPDVQLSKVGWTIEGTKLRAPLDLLHGVGEKAHQQLVAGAPYPDLMAFARAIDEQKQSGKTVETTTDDNGKTVTKTTLGRSAIHRGIVYTLVVAGAMDSLFPAGSSPNDCLDAFDAAMKAVNSGYKPPPKSKRHYPTLDAVWRYQKRKSILPAYGADLRRYFVGDDRPEFLKLYGEGNKRKLYFAWRYYSKKQRAEVDTETPVVGFERLNALQDATELPEGGFQCAVIAYLEDKEGFQYTREGNRLPAMRLTLEVGGGKYECVHWPDRNGELPQTVQSAETGSIVVALLERNKVEYGFSVREIRVLRAAIKDKETDESKAGASAGGAAGSSNSGGN